MSSPQHAAPQSSPTGPPQSSPRPIPPVNSGSSLVAVPRRDSTGPTPSETSGPSLLLPGSAADAAPPAMPILTLSVDSLSPSLADAEGLSSPTDRSPRELLRRASLSANELVLTAVRTALERHPSFGRKLGIKLVPPQMGRSLSDGSTGRPPRSPRAEKTQAAASLAAGARGPPLFSRGYWGSRACGRHTFYVVITLALLVVASQQLRLQRNFKKETIVVRRELRRKGGPWDALSNPAVRNALTAQARQGACSRMHARVCACMCMCVCACECVRTPPAAAQRAVLTMAILTMATLTMATLTMATLTMAMLAMAIRAMAGRPDRGQLLPRLPRRPDMAAHPEGQGGPDPAPRWLGGTPHAEGGPGAPRGHHACARSPPRPHLAGPRGRRHPRAPPGGGGSTRGGGGGGGQEVAAALCPAHDGVAVRPACLRVARPGLLRSCLPSPPPAPPAPARPAELPPPPLPRLRAATGLGALRSRGRAYLQLTFTTQSHRTGRGHDAERGQRGLIYSGLGSEQRHQGVRPALALLLALAIRSRKVSSSLGIKV